MRFHEVYQVFKNHLISELSYLNKIKHDNELLKSYILNMITFKDYEKYFNKYFRHDLTNEFNS